MLRPTFSIPAYQTEVRSASAPYEEWEGARSTTPCKRTRKFPPLARVLFTASTRADLSDDWLGSSGGNSWWHCNATGGREWRPPRPRQRRTGS